jgi:hypothetical protein
MDGEYLVGLGKRRLENAREWEDGDCAVIILLG